MSIEGKHAYRFGYLKSDHWKNLRLEKLVSEKATCRICKKEDFHSDVHHLTYRNWRDVQLEDLVVLCRECHSYVHELMEEDGTVNDRETSDLRWNKICELHRRKTAEANRTARKKKIQEREKKVQDRIQWKQEVKLLRQRTNCFLLSVKRIDRMHDRSRQILPRVTRAAAKEFVRTHKFGTDADIICFLLTVDKSKWASKIRPVYEMRFGKSLPPSLRFLLTVRGEWIRSLLNR